MSSEALAWAFKQNCKTSSVKFTLIALCECANYKTGRITPSIAHISEITGQNRKTVIANIAALEAAGLIRDTGEKIGRTMQIKVYEAVLESVPKAEQSQKRNSSVSRPKQSQKRDTEPSLEPSLKPKEARARELPIDWKPAQFGIGTKSRAIIDGWHPDEHAAHLEGFIAFHRTRGNKYPDWQAAWSTWTLNTVKFNRGSQSGKRPANDEIQNPYVRVAMRNQARREAERAGAEFG